MGRLCECGRVRKAEKPDLTSYRRRDCRLVESAFGKRQVQGSSTTSAERSNLDLTTISPNINHPYRWLRLDTHPTSLRRPRGTRIPALLRYSFLRMAGFCVASWKSARFPTSNAACQNHINAPTNERPRLSPRVFNLPAIGRTSDELVYLSFVVSDSGSRPVLGVSLTGTVSDIPGFPEVGIKHSRE